jgi:DNA ligase-associated metallophosphoesterase
MDQHRIEIELRGETLEVWPERVVYWPERRTLMLADSHWGREDEFEPLGIAVPGCTLQAELSTLGDCIARSDAQRLIVLGDMIHSDPGITSHLRETIANWRRRHDIELLVVPGNHEQQLDAFPDDWNISVTEPQLEIGPFVLQHRPGSSSDGYVLAGHLHPTVDLRGNSDRVNLPCFHLGPDYGVLPAFCDTKDGVAMPRRSDDRIYAITDKTIVDVCERASNRSCAS